MPHASRIDALDVLLRCVLGLSILSNAVLRCLPAGLVLRVLYIRVSTCYDGRHRRVAPSWRTLDDTVLLEQIVKIRAAHEFAATFGSAPKCGWNCAPQ